MLMLGTSLLCTGQGGHPVLHGASTRVRQEPVITPGEHLICPTEQMTCRSSSCMSIADEQCMQTKGHLLSLLWRDCTSRWRLRCSIAVSQQMP